MPCGLCRQSGHNRSTCPQKADGQVSVYPPCTKSPAPQHVPPRPVEAPPRGLTQQEMEAIIKERNDLLEKNNDLVEEVYALRANNLLYREGGRQLREQVIRLQNHINSLRKANIVCDMQLRKDLAETLFDKKSDIPDGIYLELMNKLRI